MPNKLFSVEMQYSFYGLARPSAMSLFMNQFAAIKFKVNQIKGFSS